MVRFLASSLTLVGLTLVSIGPAISVIERGCAGLPACAITAAAASTFAAAGAEIALLDVNLAAAREQAKAVSATALPVECDVTDAGSVTASFDKIAAAFGGVDIVVSNAAFYTKASSSIFTATSAWRRPR